MATIENQAAMLADSWAGKTEPAISALIGDRIARAGLLNRGALALALDFNARLVTELRERGIWPARYQPPEGIQT